MKRINSIDFTRGLVIVLMALDHIRDLLHTTSLTHDPLDLNTTTPALFMTRWITHLCAPVFVFLAGTSAYLTLKSQDNLHQTTRLLRTRGLWLILLELTVITFGVWFDVYFRTILLQVIYAIGMGFFILSFLLRLPARTLGIIGLVIIFLHNLIPTPGFVGSNTGGFLWSMFLSPNFFQLTTDFSVIIGYPAIPWLGIMLFGFGFGQVFEMTPEARKRILTRAAVISLLVFGLLRGFNLYGDPSPWSVQSTTINTVLSFINVTKYPPSLLYTSVIMGIMFIILRMAEGANNSMTRFFIVYGRVPFFFYLIHWYIIHISMFVMIFIQGAQWKDFPYGAQNFGRPETGVGIELPYIYLYWLCLILVLYPLCRRFGKYKAANRDKKWLAYI